MGAGIEGGRGATRRVSVIRKGGSVVSPAFVLPIRRRKRWRGCHCCAVGRGREEGR